MASAVPLAGGAWLAYHITGRPTPARGEEPESLFHIVSPGYLNLLRIPLVAGRAFTEADSALAPRVAIVNQNLAHSAFGSQSPIGKMLTILPDRDASIAAGTVEIVGLAANSREVGLDEVPFQDIYLPFAQAPQRSISLAVKTHGSPAQIAARMRERLQTLDPDSVLYNIKTMDEFVAEQFRGEQFHMLLVGVFSALAALLAAVGTYGAIAFSAAQRTREFGLRKALGAMPGAIRKLMLARTTRLTLSGAAAGLAVCLFLGQILQSALYMVPHHHTGLIYAVGIRDPLSLLSAAAIVLALAALASLGPASRAAKVEPLAALRDE